MGRRPLLASAALSPFLSLAARVPAFASVVPVGYPALVEVSSDAAYRYIHCNGIPQHGVGVFPNAENPNAIAPQNYTFRVLLRPEPGPTYTPLGMHPFGVAVNGVPFDPLAAEWWNRDRTSGWQYEALSSAVHLGIDDNHAHVQPGGAYHYHGLPTGLMDDWPTGVHSPLVGYAADGFPIYALYGFADGRGGPVRLLSSSYRLKSGTRPGGPGGPYDGRFTQDYEYVPGLGDLDQANGRETVTPDYPDGTYAYFLTEEWPVIPRSFRGTPVTLRGPDGGPGPRGGGPPGGGRPPRGGGGPGGFPPPPPPGGRRPPPPPR
ncbi:MAG: YHYH protein [Rhodospirillaceae bacterium]|nr:YHYH protein [Rhodospirillaceae bacterium]